MSSGSIRLCDGITIGPKLTKLLTERRRGCRNQEEKSLSQVLFPRCRSRSVRLLCASYTSTDGPSKAVSLGLNLANQFSLDSSISHPQTSDLSSTPVLAVGSTAVLSAVLSNSSRNSVVPNKAPSQTKSQTWSRLTFEI